MKTIQRITNYCLLRKIEQNDYYYVRIWSEGKEKISWTMGYENKLGDCIIVGASIDGSLFDKLENEYQTTVKNTPTPFLTFQQIQSLEDDRLLSIIKQGESLNWDILFNGEIQEQLDEYMNHLYREKKLRKL